MAVSFDRIANIYDATRWAEIPPPIMEKILSAMKDALKGCRSILDVGTGIGRFAQFFKDSGFNIVGVDISLRMMIEARKKGVRDVVRADAQQLPFRDGVFDGSIMIHVLHLVKNWVRVVHEVGRVTRNILVSEAGDIEGFSARQKYLELRADMGYPLKRFNEAEVGLRRQIHPKITVSVGDYWTDINAGDEINAFEARRSSVMWDVPEGVHRRIMQKLRQDYQGKNVRRHDFAEVVGWDPAQLRAFRT